MRWCWVIREPTHKPVKPPNLFEPTLPPEYMESPSEYAEVHNRNPPGFRYVPVWPKTTQICVSFSNTGGRSRVWGGGTETRSTMGHCWRGGKHREGRWIEREIDQPRKQRTRSSIGHLWRNKRRPLVDLRPDFQPIIGGSTPAKLRLWFFCGFSAVRSVTNLTVFPMDFLNSYDLVWFMTDWMFWLSIGWFWIWYPVLAEFLCVGVSAHCQRPWVWLVRPNLTGGQTVVVGGWRWWTGGSGIGCFHSYSIWCV
jgi:hypothetical protein